MSRLLAELLVLPPQSHVLLVQLVEGADGAIAAPRSTRTTSGDGGQPPRSEHDDWKGWPVCGRLVDAFPPPPFLFFLFQKKQTPHGISACEGARLLPAA